jgi:protein-disulfide isomerase
MVAALGCHAQTSVPAGGAQAIQVGVKLTPEMARRVEVMIRSKAQVSPEYTILIGEPTQGEVPGYDQIMVTFTENGSTSKPLPFLLSTDGKTLAQFNKFDLSQDPKDKVSAVGRPARGGAENAPVLIVGFDDLECPYCAQMNAEIFPAIQNRYKDQVRMVYRDFPLVDIHPWAMHAAVDANCLGATSTAGYWNFIDYVHAHADQIVGSDPAAGTDPTSGADQAERFKQALAKADATLDKLAMDEGARQKVNPAELASCVQKQDDSKVKASEQLAEGDPLHLGSAPILFINGEEVIGVVPIETIYRIIDGALIAAGQTPPPPPPPVNPLPATPAAAPAAVAAPASATAPAPVAAKPGS